jgi:hypothetical protein
VSRISTSVVTLSKVTLCLYRKSETKEATIINVLQKSQAKHVSAIRTELQVRDTRGQYTWSRRQNATLPLLFKHFTSLFHCLVFYDSVSSGALTPSLPILSSVISQVWLKVHVPGHRYKWTTWNAGQKRYRYANRNDLPQTRYRCPIRKELSQRCYCCAIRSYLRRVTAVPSGVIWGVLSLCRLELSQIVTAVPSGVIPDVLTLCHSELSQVYYSCAIRSYLMCVIAVPSRVVSDAAAVPSRVISGVTVVPSGVISCVTAMPSRRLLRIQHTILSKRRHNTASGLKTSNCSATKYPDMHSNHSQCMFFVDEIIRHVYLLSDRPS